VSKRDFLAVEDWSPGEIEALFRLAVRVKRGEIKGGLERKILAMVFLDPSLRTRTSFDAAMFLHGGHAVVLEPGKGSWALETEDGVVMDQDAVEHVTEAARVLGRYADALAVRAFPRGAEWAAARQDAVIRKFAQHCERPVINLESSRRHPCQELADAFTLRERLGETHGKRFVLTWAWHPKALPTAVPVSAALAAARMGMDVTIAAPEGCDLDPEDMQMIQAMAGDAGARPVTMVHDQDAAMSGADAVYAKSWGPVAFYGQPEQQRSYFDRHRGWRLTADRVRATRNGKAIVMHCLPVRRNVEIDDAVLDGPNAVVVDEAENRLHVQRALLLTLLGNGA
jgi:N-acetylornithine carbamoyltransferase